MPKLSAKQQELMEIAMVVLDEFPEASEMTEDELNDEVFMG